MELSDEKRRQYVRRLMLSRMRLLCSHGFYGLLLMHMIFSVDEECETASTDGKRIFFGSEFLDELSDSELDFVMMHEVLHVVLQHCFRGKDYDKELFNIACDIVVNSNIMLSNNGDEKSICIRKYGVSMHKAPDGREGHLYTAEEVYDMLCSVSQKQYKQKFSGMDKDTTGGKVNTVNRWDNHEKWGKSEEDESIGDIWAKRFRDACEAVAVRESFQQYGLLPAFARRQLLEMKKAKTDWRMLLDAFVQEEVNDYSFYPPDRRFDDAPFFLPDFNEKEEYAEDILFMIDTSGSMTDEMITEAYSEVKGAVDQFGGRLCGWLGFFDAEVIEPIPFCDEEGLIIIRPSGGGGTSFHCIFSYIEKNMQDHLPVSIIILTDGYAPFPEEKAALGIPVLWLLNNDYASPPWGRTARLV